MLDATLLATAHSQVMASYIILKPCESGSDSHRKVKPGPLGKSSTVKQTWNGCASSKPILPPPVRHTMSLLEEKVRQSRRNRSSLVNTPGLVERQYASSVSKVPAEDQLRFDSSNGDYFKLWGFCVVRLSRNLSINKPIGASPRRYLRMVLV